MTARRPRRRVGGVVLLVVLLAAAGTGAVLTWRSGVLDVRTVEVRGAERSGVATVLDLVGPVTGTPLPTVDTDAVAARVSALPLVLSVTVSRRYPGTLVVEVSERTPVAAVPVEGGYALLDDAAVTVATQAQAPAGLPVVHVDPAAGAGPLQAALAVSSSLPAALAERTSQVSALSAADVRLVVDGHPVRWGTPGDTALKAEVLQLLLDTVPASGYDVSAPTAPATTP